jgi:hypothetical protein
MGVDWSSVLRRKMFFWLRHIDLQLILLWTKKEAPQV